MTFQTAIWPAILIFQTVILTALFSNVFGWDIMLGLPAQGVIKASIISDLLLERETHAQELIRYNEDNSHVPITFELIARVRGD